MEESAERFWPSSAKVEVASQIRAAPIVSGPWDWRREATTTSAKELLRLKPSAAAAAPCLRANPGPHAPSALRAVSIDAVATAERLDSASINWQEPQEP